MPLYKYVKFAPKQEKKRPAYLAYVFIGFGALIIVWTTWPILSFFLVDFAINKKTISPVSDIIYAANKETVNANYWFPTNPQKKVVTPVNSYTLSIPTLNIIDATVIIGSDDLSKSAIHYGGTAVPGEYGNAVIFGHSSLPQLFKGAKDYKTIFSTLPAIKIGDEIRIRYDMVTYVYKVYDKVVLDPSDLSTLEQHFDDSYITLVTCVPPGTLLYRLNVKARLVKI